MLAPNNFKHSGCKLFKYWAYHSRKKREKEKDRERERESEREKERERERNRVKEGRGGWKEESEGGRRR